MQIVVGGAFNGKREYINQHLIGQDVQWIECREVESFPEASSKTIVVAGIEATIERYLKRPEEEVMQEIMDTLHTYGKQSDVIVIVTEIGRGIVPISSETRELRDRCGRLNQMIFKKSKKVTRVWYGLTEKLK